MIYCNYWQEEKSTTDVFILYKNSINHSIMSILSKNNNLADIKVSINQYFLSFLHTDGAININSKQTVMEISRKYTTTKGKTKGYLGLMYNKDH